MSDADKDPLKAINARIDALDAHIQHIQDQIQEQLGTLCEQIEWRDSDYKFMIRAIVAVCMGILALSGGILALAIKILLDSL